MRKLWILVALYFRGLGAGNQKREPSKLRKAGLYALGVFILASLLITVVVYAFLIAEVLYPLGQIDLLLTMVMAVVSIVTLLFTILRIAPVVFQFADYPLQAALPIRRETLVLSRLVIFYLQILLLALGMMLPTLGVYAYFVRPGISVYLLATFATLFIPAIPVAIGTVLGLLVSLSASRLRVGKNAVQIAFGLILSLGVAWLSFSAQTSITPEAMENISLLMREQVMRLYPAASLFHSAIFETDIVALILFAGFGILALGVFTLLIGRYFTKIYTALNTTKTRGGFQIASESAGLTKGNSVKMALLKREFKRYFGTPVYVFNTILGPILILALGIYAFAQREMLPALLAELPPQFTTLAPGIIGMAAIAIMPLGNTTAAAISIEGRQVDILKSLPVSAHTIFQAKTLVNIILVLPSLLIYLVFAGLALNLQPLQWLVSALIPLTFLLFYSNFGLVLSLHFPKLDWADEAVPVKQSMSVLYCLFGGWILIAGTALLAYRFAPANLAPYFVLLFFVLLDFALSVYLRSKRAALWFARL